MTSGQGGRGALFRIQNRQAKQTCCIVLTYEFLYPVTTIIPSLCFFQDNGDGEKSGHLAYKVLSLEHTQDLMNLATVEEVQE